MKKTGNTFYNEIKKRKTIGNVDLALSKYAKNEASLSGAAEIAGLNILEMRKLVTEVYAQYELY